MLLATSRISARPVTFKTIYVKFLTELLPAALHKMLTNACSTVLVNNYKHVVQQINKLFLIHCDIPTAPLYNHKSAILCVSKYLTCLRNQQKKPIKEHNKHRIENTSLLLAKLNKPIKR